MTIRATRQTTLLATTKRSDNYQNSSGLSDRARASNGCPEAVNAFSTLRTELTSNTGPDPVPTIASCQRTSTYAPAERGYSIETARCPAFRPSQKSGAKNEKKQRAMDTFALDLNRHPYSLRVNPACAGKRRTKSRTSGRGKRAASNSYTFRALRCAHSSNNSAAFSVVRCFLSKLSAEACNAPLATRANASG